MRRSWRDVVATHRATRVALGVACVLGLLLTRVFVEFEKVRIKLIQHATAPSDRSVRVMTDTLDALVALQQPSELGLLLTRVFVEFEKVRIKLIQHATAPSDRSVRVMTDTLDALVALQQPSALIAKLENQSPKDDEFAITVDGRTICRRNDSICL